MQLFESSVFVKSPDRKNSKDSCYLNVGKKPENVCGWVGVDSLTKCSDSYRFNSWIFPNFWKSYIFIAWA